MSALLFSFAEIPKSLDILGKLFQDNVLLFILSFASYFIFFFYNMINSEGVDTEIYEADVLSSGVSSIMTALLLVGLDDSTKGFSLAKISLKNNTTVVALVLLVYGALLMIFAFLKILPHFMVVIIGNSELDMLINIIAILISESIKVTGTMIILLAVPLTVLFLIQRIRKAMS